MGWLIALAVLVGLGFLPLGFRAVYRESDPGVWVLIGPLKLRVYLGNRKPEQSKISGKTVKSETKGGNYRDFRPVIDTIVDFLGEFRRKICVNHLELKLILAGDDPSDLAVNYGKAWAILGSLIPQLEQLFKIKKRDLEVECDFTSDKTLIFARVDATITLARTLCLLSRHGAEILRRLFELKKLRKGGAKL